MKYKMGLFLVWILKLLLHIRAVRIVNCIYNRQNFVVKDFIKRRLNCPKYSFIWPVVLLNKKIIKVNVKPGRKWNWDFALSYHQHDTGVCIIEKVLNDFYPLNFDYFDIGANYGLRTLYAISINRRSFLFEPNVSLKPFTQELYLLNGYDKFIIETMCLSDKTGKLPFYVSEIPYNSSFDLQSVKQSGSFDEIKVNVNTLDNYIKENTGCNPKIIKIDVEGHELEVISGAAETIAKFKPALIIELLDKSVGCSDVINRLNQMGYFSFAIRNNDPILLKKFNPANFLEQKENNYLFVHENDEITTKLKSFINID